MSPSFDPQSFKISRMSPLHKQENPGRWGKRTLQWLSQDILPALLQVPHSVLENFSSSSLCSELLQPASQGTYSPLCRKGSLSFPSMLRSSTSPGSSRTCLPCSSCFLLSTDSFISFSIAVRFLKKPHCSIPTCCSLPENCPPERQFHFTAGLFLYFSPCSDSFQISARQAYADLCAKRRYIQIYTLIHKLFKAAYSIFFQVFCFPFNC